MKSNKESRFARILRMIPFLVKHQGILINEACKILGVNERELIADLNLLWVCGLPGYSHLELIDVQFEGGYISISNADTLAKPRKLTKEESTVLVVALNSLLLHADPESKELILDLISKLMGISESSNQLLNMDISTLTNVQDLYLVDVAILNKGRIFIEYYSPTSDQITSREIAPLEYLEDTSGQKYLYAWCYNACDYRKFRINRIRAISEIALKSGSFTPASKIISHTSKVVDLELDENAIWFAEEWGILNLEREGSDDQFTGSVQVHNDDWAIRAVLALAGQLRIAKEPALSRQITDRASGALANYDS